MSRVVRHIGLGEPMPEGLFGFVLELEVRKALRLRYCVSLVCVAPDVEPHDIDPKCARHMAARAAQQLRTIDAVTIFHRDALGLLLVDADPAKLGLILNRVVEDLWPDPVTTPGRARRPTWSAGGSSYPTTAQNKGELLGQALNLMLKARKEGGNRSYLPGNGASTATLDPSAL